MRRLVYDFETSPNVCLSFRIGRKINLNPESIISERKIITVSWKWVGSPRIYSLSWDKNQCDKAMLIKFAKILEEADEAIAYFGDSYDLPFFRTRCLIHGIKINSELKTVDPLKWVRGKFFFNSGKLDYVSQVLGVGKKLHTDFSLWRDIVLSKSPEALAKMIRYNRRDIQILEGVWKKLSEQMPAKTHAGVMSGGERWSCPKCASTDVRTNKTRVTAKGAKQMQMICEKGHYYSLSEASHKAYLER